MFSCVDRQDEDVFSAEYVLCRLGVSIPSPKPTVQKTLLRDACGVSVGVLWFSELSLPTLIKGGVLSISQSQSDYRRHGRRGASGL